MRNTVLLLIVIMAAFGDAKAVYKVWNNPDGGSWYDDSNWTPYGAPQPFDDADITLAGTYTVFLDSSARVGNLYLGGLYDAQTLEIIGFNTELQMYFNSEVGVSGHLRVLATAKLRLTFLGALMNYGTILTNYGVITFEDASFLHLGEGCSLENWSNGLVNFVGDVLVTSHYFPGTDSDITNMGQMIKSGGGLLDLQCWLFNIDSGTFLLTEGQVQAPYTETESNFILAPGTTFYITTQDTNSAFHLHPAGTLELQGTAAIIGIDGGENIHNEGVVRHTGIDTGIVEVEFEELGVPVEGDVIVEEGVLYFRGQHNLSYHGLVEIGPEAELIADENAEFMPPCTVASAIPDSGTLTLQGDFMHFIFGQFTFSGVFQLRGNCITDFYPSNTIDTLRVLRTEPGITLNADQTIYTRAFDMNGGVINADVVVVEEQDWTGGNLGDGSGDSVTIEPGATLEVSGPEDKQLDGSTLTIEGNAIIGGSGEITVTDANIIVAEEGTMTVGDSVTITSESDTLINTGQMTINSPLDTSTFNIFILNYIPVTRTPGTIDILGRTTFGAGMSNRGNMNLLPSSELILPAQLSNEGSVVLGSGSQINLQSTLINEPAGVIELEGDSRIGGDGEVDNSGQMFSGGGFFLSLTNRVISPYITNQAVTGFIDVRTDTLTLQGGGVNYGDIEIHAGAVLVILGTFENAPGGLIHGAGTLDVGGATFVNNGTISPGSSPGVFTIRGNMTLGPTSQIDMDLGGAGVPGALYDQLRILGQLIGGGRLNLLFAGGYIPSPEDTLEMFQYQSFLGAFGEINGRLLPNGEYMALRFGPTGLKVFACLGESPGFGFPNDPLRITCTEGVDTAFSIQMCNTGGCPLVWSTSFSATSPVVPNWLTITANAAGFLPDLDDCVSMNFVVTVAGLSPGTYLGALTVSSNEDVSPVREIPVILRVRVPGEIDLCNQDPELTYTSRVLLQPQLTARVRTQQFKLNWSRIPGADYYQVLAGTGMDSLSAVAMTYDTAWTDTSVFTAASQRIGFYHVVAQRTLPIGIDDADQDLIAAWHFEEGSGSTSLDESGNGHTATLHNTNWYPYEEGLLYCTGLGFGSNKWAVVANADAFYHAPLQTDVHLKVDQLPVGSSGYILGNARYSPNNGGFAWRVEADGKLLAMVWNGSGWSSLRSVIPVSLNDWFTATLIINGSQSMMLIDGIVVAAGNLVLNDHNNNMPLTIGASALPNGNHQYYLQGQIGWLKIREFQH